MAWRVWRDFVQAKAHGRRAGGEGGDWAGWIEDAFFANHRDSMTPRPPRSHRLQFAHNQVVFGVVLLALESSHCFAPTEVRTHLVLPVNGSFFLADAAQTSSFVFTKCHGIMYV